MHPMFKPTSMFKTTLATFSCAALLLLSACGSSEPTAPANSAAPAAPAAPTPVPDISYGAGFSEMERNGDGLTWRWMADSGTIQLRNKKADALLKIEGDLPMGSFNGPAKITIKFNGETLEQVTIAKDKPRLEKEFTIPAAKQSTGEFSELVIQSDKFFIPKLVDKNATDDRKLSFSLTKLEWTAK